MAGIGKWYSGQKKSFKKFNGIPKKWILERLSHGLNSTGGWKTKGYRQERIVLEGKYSITTSTIKTGSVS